MARKRMIDPSLWTDEGMAELTPRQQLLYIGMFSNADDDGRLKGSPQAIRLMLPAVYAAVPTVEIAADLAAVREQFRQLVAYEADGRQYLAFSNYRRWQRIDRPSESMLPPPPEESRTPPDDSANARRMLDEDAVSARPSRARAEVSLEEEKLEEVSLDEEKRGGERAAAAVAPMPPDELRAFDLILQRAPGYAPSPEFYEKVLERYRGVDLGEEALKLAGWLNDPRQRAKRRTANTATVLSWLKRAATDQPRLEYRNGHSNGVSGHPSAIAKYDN